MQPSLMPGLRIGSRLLADRQAIVDVLPVVGCGISRIDAERLGGVDRLPRGEQISLCAVLRGARLGRPDPGVRITWPRHESAFGIAARHRAIRSISAVSAAISRAANSLRGTSDTSRPVRAASANTTR